MSLVVEYHALTGTISNPTDGLIALGSYPTTGVGGGYDISVDVIGGNSMELGKDFGLTGVGTLNTLTYNLERSDIKKVRQEDIDKYGSGYTGIELRVSYNKE